MTLFTLVQQTAYGFPKYFITMMPALCIVASKALAELRLSDVKVFNVVVAVALLIPYNFIILKDPFIAHNFFYTSYVTLTQNLSLYVSSTLQGILYFIPLLIAFTLFLILRWSKKTAFLFSILIVFLTTALYIDFVQTRADYSTIYAYGQEGLIEASEYVAQHSTEADILIARSDIGFYTSRKYYMSFPARQELIDNFYPIINSQNVTYIVTSPSEKLPDFSANFTSDAEFGHFKIYRKISRSPPLAQG